VLFREKLVRPSIAEKEKSCYDLSSVISEGRHIDVNVM
jgi:hypothetical protein